MDEVSCIVVIYELEFCLSVALIFIEEDDWSSDHSRYDLLVLLGQAADDLRRQRLEYDSLPPF
jgi:hypothetical protein